MNNNNSTGSTFSCKVESSKTLSEVLSCLIDPNRKDEFFTFEVTNDCKWDLKLYFTYFYYSFYVIVCQVLL